MVQRRDLNAPPGQKLADVVKALREKAESSKTGAHGVKHMGEHGDVTWPGTGPDGQPATKSVKRFQVELDDTTERAEQLAEDLAASVIRLGDAETNLSTLRDVTLPAVRAALEQADQDASAALQDALGRIDSAEGAITDAEADLVSLRQLLDNTDLADLEQRLTAALADIEHFQSVTMPALDQRLADAEQIIAQLEDIDIADLTLRLGANETGLTELRETTLPGLEQTIQDRIASTEAGIRADLASATGDLAGARSDLDQAMAQLDVQDTELIEARERMAVLAKQAQRGPVPEPGSPLGAHWISPQGHMYVRVSCEEEVA